MKSIAFKILNNAAVNRILIFLRIDHIALKFKNNWSLVKLDHQKTLQQNMGFSEKKEIQEVLDIIHGKIKHIYAQYCTGGPVLDIGCGVGLYLSDFADSVVRHGVDVSGDFLETARKRLPAATFHHGDYLQIDPGITFQMIYSVGVMQYIPPSRIPSLFTKIGKDLQSKGIVLIQYPHATSLGDCLYPDLTYVQYSPMFVEKALSEHFDILSHRHSYDDRVLDFKFDPVKYDPEMGKSFRNCGIIIGMKR